jgi:hypothetical protein
MNGKYIFPQRVVSMSHRMETAQAIKKVTQGQLVFMKIKYNTMETARVL